MKILLCIIDTLSSLPGRSKYSRIFSCPDGITPNSGLTGLSILYIYIYIYIYWERERERERERETSYR